MNKKTRALIGGAGVSAAVAAVALSGGTSAFFYDVQTVENNSISSCGFELESAATVVAHPYSGVNTSRNLASQVLASSEGSNILVEKMQPGDGFTATLTVTNSGDSTCAADAWWDINYPISGIDGSGNPVTNPGAGVQPFTQALQTSLSGDTSSTAGNLDELIYESPEKLGRVAPGASKSVVINVSWPLGARSEGNELMDHSVSFTLDYALSQVGINPVGANGLSEPFAP